VPVRKAEINETNKVSEMNKMEKEKSICHVLKNKEVVLIK
jgi:hypothetical protein